ncbi:MAG: Gfo/Idh/MocA family oxidoreductase [Actinomycetota bacterium]
MLGAGAWGKNHVRVLAELGHLATVCEPDAVRASAVEREHRDVRVTTVPDDVFEDDAVDAVVIATPAVTHAALAEAALQSGKDVLVEKPLALHVEEAARIVDAAAKLDRVVAVGHVLEYHPAVARLRELVASGHLGQIRYLYSNRSNFGRIRTEENVLWSFAPHDVAILLRLLGAAPTEVSCHGGSYVSHGVADSTLTAMTFDRGVQAHIYVSWLHPFKEQRFVVVGSRRMAVFDDTAPWQDKLVTFSHAVDWDEGRIPVARAAHGEPEALTECEPLRAQAEAFVEAIRTRKPPLADAASGLAVLRVLTAATESLEKGGVPVRLSDVAGVFVHPTAFIDDGASIGPRTKVWHHAHVMTDASVGADCTLGKNVFVGRGVVIGDGCKIQNNVSIFDGVTLEGNVFCGPSMVFTNVRNPRAEVDRVGRYDRTRVGEGATLGANATIVCGNSIGRYAFVGAGAVVTKEVPDHALVAGNPAQRLGWVCRCGERLPDDGEPVCSLCGRRYTIASEGLRDA